MKQRKTAETAAQEETQEGATSTDVPMEIKFARKLATNDPKKRRAAIKILGAYLGARGAVMTDLEMRKLWRGLFFCMWLADKPKVQADLAGHIGALVQSLGDAVGMRRWFSVMVGTMKEEWGRLDKYRVDKYYTLLRRVLRENLIWLGNRDWDKEDVKSFAQTMHSCVWSCHHPNGIRLHLADILIEELFQTGAETVDSSTLILLIEPLLNEIATTMDGPFFSRVEQRLFVDLVERMTKSGESDMDEEGDDENDTSESFSLLELEPIQTRIFDLAACPETRQIHRARLYALHRQFQSLTGKTVVLTPLLTDAGSSLTEGNGVNGSAEEDRENRRRTYDTVSSSQPLSKRKRGVTEIDADDVTDDAEKSAKGKENTETKRIKKKKKKVKSEEEEDCAPPPPPSSPVVAVVEDKKKTVKKKKKKIASVEPVPEDPKPTTATTELAEEGGGG
eukprot:CAMPEP_0185773034 /NCGR_PEP_ID=MMETSP1174-20130828/72250_1 /TAXON_ID=35687 /ORGANISM="Dictyocha speculum, Strain CCMP1381" /LENGTH=448 /DNA_ID=CAMNT_0028459569 /DNA_START=21 /DNA_END=1363 /DNA_ORIENTATION=-